MGSESDKAVKCEGILIFLTSAIHVEIHFQLYKKRSSKKNLGTEL